MIDLTYSSINTILNRLVAGETSACGLLETVLARIEAYNPRVGAITAVTAEQARREAERVDAQRRAGIDPGPLGGLPVAIKEIVDTTPAPCSSGLSFLKDHRPAQDAPVVQRLRDAGAVIVGVTASDPGAFGVRTDAAFHPQAPDRSVGGSSGGSAAAVAAGFAYGALGTDTGGSVRIPAACCLTASLKPTYGRVPVKGVRPLAPSLDHVGPMTRRVADLAPLQHVLDTDFPATRSRLNLETARIGFDPDYYSEAGPVIGAAVDRALERCVARGCKIVRVRLPAPEDVLKVHGVILLSEAAAFYEQAGLADHPEMPALPRSNIDAARRMTAIQYANAAHRREVFRAQVKALFSEVDFLLAPTLPALTPLRSETAVMIGDVLHEYTPALVRYTSLFNHTGNPVVSMPSSILGPGLGVGLQIVAGHDRDADAVAFATRLEADLGLEVDWRLRSGPEAG